MSRDQMNALLDDAIRTAVRFLENHGEFYPFAVTMTRDGEIRHVHLHPNEYVESSDAAIGKLVAGLRRTRGEEDMISNAIVADVHLPENQTDAIRVELEGLDAQPVVCVVPYQRRSDLFELGELRASPGERRIFK